MTTVPVLHTERLVLRGLDGKDWEGFRDFFGSDRSRYVGGPLESRDAWRLFAVEFGHWDIRGYGMWAVTEKGNDTCLGIVGCWYPEGWPEKEIGWLLWPGAEGRGIAYEAAQATRNHAYFSLGWSGAVSYIDHGNDRSAALAQRLGAVLDPTATPPPPKDEPCQVFRHPGPEALS